MGISGEILMNEIDVSVPFLKIFKIFVLFVTKRTKKIG